MARKATRKPVATVAAKRTTVSKAATVKSAPTARKPAAKKAPAKATRRSAADVAKLQKIVIKGFKAKKSAATLSDELGISKPYVYMLKNKV